MAGRIAPVRSTSATGAVDVAAYRNDRIAAAQSGSISVLAARPDLLPTVGATLRTGSWLSAELGRYPLAVLGATTANQLAVHQPGVRVWLGGRWFGVAGILQPALLAPELDRSVLIGWQSAEDLFDFDGHPTTVYLRTAPQHLEDVRAVLAATVNPEAPNEVRVSRPSEALAAQRAADDTLSGMLLGLGGVALLVGGIGIANTMVIAVLERRAEIGLRRSLGATRGQVRTQFLLESLLLSAWGGAGGALLGSGLTALYASVKDWPTVVPAWVLATSLGGTLAVGVVAGLYPAIRAARMSPTAALAGT